MKLFWLLSFPCIALFRAVFICFIGPHTSGHPLYLFTPYTFISLMSTLTIFNLILSPWLHVFG